MRLSDLQNKDIVDVETGEKIGNVIDVLISKDGNVIKIIIYDKKGFLSMVRNSGEIEINWSQIKKIGTDVILVSRNL